MSSSTPTTRDPAGSRRAATRPEEPSAPGIRSAKILPRHLERSAIVYVRQSTQQQVLENTESTARQYDLAAHAVALGWTKDRVIVIDEDQGLSGRGAEHRAGFQRLLAEVTMDHVGLVLGLEMSRLARSSRDWHHLLELCALFGTLLADQDGIYNPNDSNDRLLLGLKGTMSEFEQFTMRNRLERGKLHKAGRGELFLSVPIGYLKTPSGDVVIEPDEQARSVVQLIFDAFEELGTVYGVLHYLVDHKIALGIRPSRGPDRGQLVWRRPTLSTLFRVLHHPIYAGAYVYGRQVRDRRPCGEGAKPTTHRLPREEWSVLLRDRLPAYIAWERYQANQDQLRRNRLGPGSPGVARDGGALLSGLVICGTWGRRMRTGYRHSDHPFYDCARDREEAREPTCCGLSASSVDELVVRQVLKALEPAAVALSLRAIDDAVRERERLDRHWQKRLARARYDAQRSERQYQAVEPENRLVARTLEQRWERALATQRREEDDHDRFTRERPLRLSDEERTRIMDLSRDIPAMWEAEGTTNGDRKEIIRCVVEGVVVRARRDDEHVEATIHWCGGFESSHEIARSVGTYRQLRDFDQLRDRITALRAAGESAANIARVLNREGFHPPRRHNPFSREIVWQLQARFGLTSPIDKEPLRAHEWWLSALARELGTSTQKLRDWTRKGWLIGRQTPVQGLWIAQADRDELSRLRQLLARSKQESIGYPDALTTPKDMRRSQRREVRE